MGNYFSNKAHVLKLSSLSYYFINCIIQGIFHHIQQMLMNQQMLGSATDNWVKMVELIMDFCRRGKTGFITQLSQPMECVCYQGQPSGLSLVLWPRQLWLSCNQYCSEILLSIGSKNQRRHNWHLSIVQTLCFLFRFFLVLSFPAPFLVVVCTVSCIISLF